MEFYLENISMEKFRLRIRIDWWAFQIEFELWTKYRTSELFYILFSFNVRRLFEEKNERLIEKTLEFVRYFEPEVRRRGLDTRKFDFYFM